MQILFCIVIDNRVTTKTAKHLPSPKKKQNSPEITGQKEVT